MGGMFSLIPACGWDVFINCRVWLGCLDVLKGSCYELVHIFTQPDKSAGRGRKMTATPAAVWAQENSVAVSKIENINAPEIVNQIEELNPDLIIVVAFGQKIGNELIELAPKGMINVHGSLVPLYRGAAPINRAVTRGEMMTGVSVITVVEEIDAGDVLAQAAIGIGENETAEDVEVKLTNLSGPLLLQAVGLIASGKEVYVAQDNTHATKALKLKKSDGFIDFENSAKFLHNRIRGVWPWPGGSAIYVSRETGKKQNVTIALTEVVKAESKLEPGSFDKNLNVVCGKDALKIVKIKPEGSRLMDFRDFINGRGVKPNDKLLKRT